MDSKAPQLVDQAKSWAKQYGAFSNGPHGAALSGMLRVRGSWENNDAEGVANAFTDNGSMLIGGNQLKGRQSIHSYIKEAFAGDYQGSRIDESAADVYFLNPEVAMVVALGGIARAGERSLPQDRVNRSVWVTVKTGGEWLVLSYQSSPIVG
jgi:uncharacterized protein (TIGR02246 family)